MSIQPDRPLPPRLRLTDAQCARVAALLSLPRPEPPTEAIREPRDEAADGGGNPS